jgi:serine phosphatase RsbU (regulator of sigma subunit)
LDGAERQAAQLAASVSRYDGYYRAWLETGVAPLISYLEAAGPVIPPYPESTRKPGGVLGQQDIIVRAVERLPDGAFLYRSRQWSAGGGDREAESADLTAERMAQTLQTINHAAGWHTPSPEEAEREREIRIRYSAPLRYQNKTASPAEESIFGVFTLTASIPWFEERVKAFRALDDCAVFLLAPNGKWTLPESLARLPESAWPDGEPDLNEATATLKATMRQRATGSMFLRLGERDFWAVFTPLSIPGFELGVLMPKNKLFGPLDTLTVSLCLAGLLLLGLALFSVRGAALVMLRPLEHLREVADRLSQGNIHTPPPPIALTSFLYPDERGRLLRASKRLRGALAEQIRDLTLMILTRERLTSELKLARTIQEGLLPTTLPATATFAASGRLYPARDVCGDMYDCFFVSSDRAPERVCCLMGTVAARGIPAALLMGRVMPLLREAVLSGLSPAAALENANALLTGYAPPGEDESLFVTMFIGIFDIRDGSMLWASAGHRPPFSSGGETLPWSGDIPLGLAPGAKYLEQRHVFAPGSSLLFCNERLPAVRNAEGRMFGEAGILATLAERGHDPETLLEALREKLLAHCGGALDEDTAILAARWTGEPMPREPMSGETMSGETA